MALLTLALGVSFALAGAAGAWTGSAGAWTLAGDILPYFTGVPGATNILDLGHIAAGVEGPAAGVEGPATGVEGPAAGVEPIAGAAAGANE